MTATTLRYEDVTPAQWASWADCFWGPEDAERYDEEHPDDAVDALIDWNHPTPIAEIGTIVIVAARPRTFSVEWVGDLLEGVIERIDGQYGDPETEPWEPSPAVREAGLAFCRTIAAEYPVVRCDEVARIEVDPVAWTEKHRPDWMDEEGGA